jgi:hypothetical protein
VETSDTAGVLGGNIDRFLAASLASRVGGGGAEAEAQTQAAS